MNNIIEKICKISFDVGIGGKYERNRKATITELSDNRFRGGNPVTSIMMDFENDAGCKVSQGTDGYTGNFAISFIENLMKILDVKDKSEIEGQKVSTCTERLKLLAIGNESESKWIDLKNVEKIIDGDIIQYFDEKDFER